MLRYAVVESAVPAAHTKVSNKVEFSREIYWQWETKHGCEMSSMVGNRGHVGLS